MQAIILAVALLGADIEPQNRVPNALVEHEGVSYGVCFWSCTDSIGRQYNIKPLIGIRDELMAKKGPAVIAGAELNEIMDVLNAKDIKYAYWLTKDMARLERAVRAKDPVIITFQFHEEIPPGDQVPDGPTTKAVYHAVILEDIIRYKVGRYIYTNVKICDPNVNKSVIIPLAQFKKDWYGWSCHFHK